MIPLKMMIAMLLGCLVACSTTTKDDVMYGFYDIEVKTIAGETTKMDAYEGMTLLIVNTASKCGFTGQYDGLQKLYDTYKDEGFIVLGFPSNDFMRQEPGSNDEIATFCKLNYGVTFPMFEKISVKGKEQHALYRFLTSDEANPEFGGKISWNFNKFLINKKGQVVDRFGSRTSPDDEELVAAVQQALVE